MNKRGASLGGWTEGILLSVLFIAIFSGVVITGMNAKYDKTHDAGFGNTTSDTQKEFGEFVDTSTDEIKGGEAEFTSTSGLTLTSSWGILKSLTTVIWDFVTGGYITKIFSYTKAPPIVGLIFRLLFTLSVVFVILKILFKLKT